MILIHLAQLLFGGLFFVLLRSENQILFIDKDLGIRRDGLGKT